MKSHKQSKLPDQATIDLAQPIEIGFCGSVLDEKGSSFKGFRQRYAEDGTPDTAKNCGEHSALVIGQRFHNGKCQMLIRNPWGTSCNRYHKDFISTCEASGVWVDNEVLKANTFDFGYLED